MLPDVDGTTVLHPMPHIETDFIGYKALVKRLRRKRQHPMPQQARKVAFKFAGLAEVLQDNRYLLQQWQQPEPLQQLSA